jgi:dsDNA-specific endonuclease/ATPase MutS2
MNFKIGDKISFLNEKRNGVVTRIISNHQVMILDDNGFEIPVSINEIVPLADETCYTIDANVISKLKEDEKKVGKSSKLAKDEVWEVDMHFHELFETDKNISAHEKLMKQLEYFRRCMDKAISQRIKKIIFIHGIGKGTLRAEIIKALSDYEGVKYYDAPYRKYGQGALVVEM